jgi:hypothetical protein
LEREYNRRLLKRLSEKVTPIQSLFFSRNSGNNDTRRRRAFGDIRGKNADHFQSDRYCARIVICPWRCLKLSISNSQERSELTVINVIAAIQSPRVVMFCINICPLDQSLLLFQPGHYTLPPRSAYQNSAKPPGDNMALKHSSIRWMFSPTRSSHSTANFEPPQFLALDWWYLRLYVESQNLPMFESSIGFVLGPFQLTVRECPGPLFEEPMVLPRWMVAIFLSPNWRIHCS